LDAVVAASSSSSLAEAAWGLVYPDTLRVLWPFPLWKKVDRAWALERAWRRHLKNPDVTVAEWQQGICEGWRPAIAFNATAAESGARLIISSVDLPAAGGTELYRRQFFKYYPNSDIPVVRAARLAATFPYVTPMARADWTRAAGATTFGSLP